MDPRMSSSSSRQRSSVDLLPPPRRPEYADLCVPTQGRPSTSKFSAPTLTQSGSYRGTYLRSYPLTREEVSAPNKVMRLLAKLNPFSRKQRSSGVKAWRLSEKKRNKKKKKKVVVVESKKEIMEVPRSGSLLPLPPRLQQYE